MQLLLFLAYLYTNVFGLVLYSLAVKNIKYMLPYFSKPKLPVHQSPTDIDTNIQWFKKINKKKILFFLSDA